ncbi:MAG: NEW3 domain-containing protein [Thermoplasmatota archaeon]
MRVLTSILLATAMVLVWSAPTSAQVSSNNICDNPNIGCCGDLTLVLLNPDIAPGSDGFIRASGSLFVQFQAIGASADQIAAFGFSFGAHVTDFPDSVCDLPSAAWFTGQQVINYRADTNPDDGFFINLQTPLVPDGQYTAAVHAYDASNNELARFWAKAIVSNCDAGAPVERCPDDAEQHKNNDATMPWPIVLPGDGQLPDGQSGLSIEFAEPLSELKVTLNGEDITDQLEQWEGRLWDNDYVPGYGPHGLSTILVPECTLPSPAHQCVTLGEAYRWTVRELNAADVLRVEAKDAAGNLATKDIHIGSAVTGGAITAEIPILTWAANAVEVETTATQSAVFQFTIQNSGGSEGHPFTTGEAPEGWDLVWQPAHVPVPSGDSRDQEFVVTPPAGTPPGSYQVNATLEYTAGGVPKTLGQTLTVTVLPGTGGGSASGAGTGGGGGGNAGTDSGGEGEDSPGPGALVLVGLLGVAALVARRRD